MVTITGMVTAGHTNFSNDPAMITISGLSFPAESPIKVVRVNVLHNGIIVGEFSSDMVGLSSVSFDLSAALKAIWNEYDFDIEVNDALAARSSESFHYHQRPMKALTLDVMTRYIATDGVFTQTHAGMFDGGSCIIGGRTEMERMLTPINQEDVSALDGTNLRNGDASTKPQSQPERVGIDSITSYTDLNKDGTTSYFYSPQYASGRGEGDSDTPHAPLVLRDSVPYIDFLFVNRRGAVETCSGRMLEAMNINVQTKQYSRIGRPAFRPSMSMISIAEGGRRSWTMSSGYQTREWGEWWTNEFLLARRWWMLYNGLYIPITVEPAKKQVVIYDRAKQNMVSVDFTVTLALEG